MFQRSHEEIRVGILFSLTGTTGVTERGQYQSTLLAIKQINDKGGIHGKRLLPIVEDIASDPYIAAKKAEKLILSDKVVALLGTYTSACRKTIIPVLEKYDSLFLYPTQYEGEEQHPNIFYCGPLPNQQLFYFIPWLIQNLGRSFYLIGSDYIYPRETNKHIRFLVQSHLGRIVGEHYTELGNQNFSKVLKEIMELDPDVVFSTLVGENAIAFYQQYHQYGFVKPIASAITAETEFAAIDYKFAVGHYSSFPYFNTVQSPENHSFMTEYRRTYGTDSISSAMENAYNSVYLLAEALRKSSTICTSALRRNLQGISFQAPQGKIIVDKTNQHLWLNSRIGRIGENGTFEILWESGEPIQPVPFFANIDTSKNEEEIARIDDEQDPQTILQFELLTGELKKATSFLPYVFALFDHKGTLLHVFGKEKVTNPKAIPALTPGSLRWSSPPLKHSGIGQALSNQMSCVVSGPEHQAPELAGWSTIGIPIKGEIGTLQGVLGVFIDDRQAWGEKYVALLVGSLTTILANCLKLMEQSKSYLFTYQLLHEISQYIPESLFVIQNEKIIFQNDSAQRLLNERQDFVQELIHYFSENTPEEKKTMIKRLNSGELIEITLTPAEHFLYLHVKNPYHPKTSSSQLTDKEKIITTHIVGSNERFLQAISLIKSAAKTNANVLILGESGTGKELFARAIHNESERNDKPFVALNCAAIPRDLINAELFGYVDGAFTGAKKGGNPGKFEIANGGTLFLDEIGDMPLELQATLLRVLQEKEVTRLGDHRAIPIDVRIIAATNKKIKQEIAYKGSFRSDLYFRLNVFTIELPPLRERIDDIPELLTRFIHNLSLRTERPTKTVSKEAMLLLQQYNWPGNVRELENVMERAFYLSEHSPCITEDHLPKYLLDCSDEETLAHDYPTLVNVNEVKKINGHKEKDVIVETLVRFKGNISKTAKHLGISRTTLYRKLDDFNLHES